jgi:Acetyltransferase (GNAT) domain
MYLIPSCIESDKIALRRFQQLDLVPSIALMTDPAATKFLAFSQAIKNAEGATKLMETTIAAYDRDRSQFVLAVEDKESGKFVDICGLNPLEEKTVEIFYAVISEAWDRDLALKSRVGWYGLRLILSTLSVSRLSSRHLTIDLHISQPKLVFRKLDWFTIPILLNWLMNVSLSLQPDESIAPIHDR